MPGFAFVLSCVAVAGVVLTAGFALFPFIMPSSSDPASSLTVWDAVSSYRTLQVMFWAVVIFLPLIIVVHELGLPRDARQGHDRARAAGRAFALLNRREGAMWYFTWILGLGAALAFGIINVMWLEASYTFGELDEDRIRERFAKPPEQDAVECGAAAMTTRPTGIDPPRSEDSAKRKPATLPQVAARCSGASSACAKAATCCRTRRRSSRCTS